MFGQFFRAIRMKCQGKVSTQPPCTLPTQSQAAHENVTANDGFRAEIAYVFFFEDQAHK